MSIDRRSCLLGGAAAAASLVSGTSAGRAQRVIDGPILPGPAEIIAMRVLIEKFRRKYNVPGFQIAIARQGQLVYSDAIGQANNSPQEPLTPQHRFRIASISKPITSTAIFTLIESGAIKLSDRVFGAKGLLATDYRTASGSKWINEITVEHLLTHTAGGWANDRNDPMFQRPELGHSALIAWTLENQPQINRPGQVHAYSNFGYCVLGRVIEKATNLRYETYTQKAVLLPAGITGMEIAGNRLAERRPQEVRYYPQGGGDPYGSNVRRMDSHGGWIATAGDLVRFANKVAGFGRPLLLQPATLRTMTTPSNVNRGYAMGWSVNAAGNWWHTGSLPGTTTVLVRTQSKFCWAALANIRSNVGDMNRDMDALVWQMTRQVPAWAA